MFYRKVGGKVYFDCIQENLKQLNSHSNKWGVVQDSNAPGMFIKTHTMEVNLFPMKKGEFILQASKTREIF